MQTAECRTVLERLNRSLDNPEQYQAELNELMVHIRGCTDCRRGIALLNRALQTDTEDGLSCPECEAITTRICR
ncbi:MAG: hypothetical protein HC782_04510 [Gammaproteobacteria bacterium]|nr:hypothetical protein [Gammaproteobacteria bacterium]